MPEEIERFTIVVDSNIELLIKGVKQGADAVEDELKDVEKAGKRAFDETGKKAQGLGTILGKLRDNAGAFIAIFATFQKVAGFFTNLGKAVVNANAQFETYTTQFETLLGSAGAARKRMEELARFGVETPFELPGVVEASRVLEVFGGATLATGDNLRMIGDIAAGVNQPFQDVALWIGRMYDAMQSGRPFGEAAARLQEMGALSGKARAELEQMTKAGASGEELWSRFNELVGSKFAGNMERLAGTFQGVISNLSDFRDNLMRVGGEALFDEIRKDAKGLLDVISDPQMSGAIEALASALGEAAAKLVDLGATPALQALEDLDPEEIQNLADALTDAANALAEFLEQDTSTNINDLIDGTSSIIDSFTTVINIFNRIKDTISGVTDSLGPFGEGLEKIGLTFQILINPAKGMAQAFSDLNNVLEYFTGLDVGDYFREAAEASETEAQAAERAREAEAARWQGLADMYQAQQQATESIEETSEALEEQTQKLSAAQKAMAKYTTDLLDLADSNQQAMQELEQNHVDRMVEIEEEYQQEIADAQAELNDAMQEAAQERTEALQEAAEERNKALIEAEQKKNQAIEDLEREVTQKRQDIIESTREALAKLEADTDRKLQDEQEDFDRDELRRTEDHLRDMRRIRRRYLDDVEDAVKNRDARALADARRRYQREQQDTESNFQTEEQRRQEDHDLRLQEIREEEQRRAEEIMLAQEKQLQDLQEYERQKREEIQRSYQEQVAQAEQAYAEQTAKIEQAYQEQIAKAQENFEQQTAQAEEHRAQQAEQEAENYAQRQEDLDNALKERLERIAKALADEEDINEGEAKRILETLGQYFGAGGEIDQLMEDFARRRAQRIEIEIAFSGGEAPATPPPGYAPGPAGGGPLPAPIPFQHGGAMIARRPTLAQFGEVPELAQFIPLSRLNNRGQNMPERMEIDLKFSGSAPPGIRSTERDQIAQVLVSAFREAGFARTNRR